MNKIKTSGKIKLIFNPEASIDKIQKNIENQVLPELFRNLSPGQPLYMTELHSTLISIPEIERIDKIELYKESEINKIEIADFALIVDENELLIMGSIDLEVSRE